MGLERQVGEKRGEEAGEDGETEEEEREIPSVFFYYSFFLFFGCTGSSLLCASSLYLWQAGTTLCWGVWASHCGGFSCWGLQL